MWSAMSQKPFSSCAQRVHTVFHSSKRAADGGSASTSASITPVTFVSTVRRAQVRIVRTEPSSDRFLVVLAAVVFHPFRVRVSLDDDPGRRLRGLFLEPQAHFSVAQETGGEGHDQLRPVT